MTGTVLGSESIAVSKMDKDLWVSFYWGRKTEAKINTENGYEDEKYKDKGTEWAVGSLCYFMDILGQGKPLWESDIEQKPKSCDCLWAGVGTKGGGSQEEETVNAKVLSCASTTYVQSTVSKLSWLE